MSIQSVKRKPIAIVIVQKNPKTLYGHSPVLLRGTGKVGGDDNEVLNESSNPAGSLRALAH